MAWIAPAPDTAGTDMPVRMRGVLAEGTVNATRHYRRGADPDRRFLHALAQMSTAPAIEPSQNDPQILRATGDWTLQNAEQLLAFIEAAPASAKDIDGRDLGALDSTGAMLLSRYAIRVGLGLATVEVQEKYQSMVDSVRKICETPPRRKRRDYGFNKMLARLGYSVEDYSREVLALIGFGGLTLQTMLRTLFKPSRIRLTPTVHHMEQVGLDAVPLVLLLSFMVGAVIAFLGATVLREFGAEIFVVELVGIAFLREFGVLLTAILLAGRTASAFTAQIGAMQSGEEIDAIRTLGLDPIELLVLPRLFALLIMLPLLTFLAMMAGLLGGMAVCVTSLDLSPELFFTRLHESVELRHFLVGISKAPIFAVVIALIGCLEGFQTQGTAQSVGERTTSSVVQTISLVILLDAAAALFFMEMDW
jgi:phospholipid/cholesterol/gamma-HCH transport system permease protein